MEKTKLIVDHRLVKVTIEGKRNIRLSDNEMAEEAAITRRTMANWINEAPSNIKALFWMIKESGLTFEQIVREVPIK